MKNSFDTFAKSAENLSKNPLGIIGLFLVLVYGIAGLVVTTTQELGNARVYLIWFLILFPPMILLVFYNLVTKHYNKLYSPSDYKDEGNFMKAIDKLTNSIENDLHDEEVDNSEREATVNTLRLIEELQNQVKELVSEVNDIRHNGAEDIKESS